jgi:Txe/YoeB family toxin of Txe-Axe toxin-antitoxin module
VKLVFSDEAWEDYVYWQKQDRKMVERINKLIQDVGADPNLSHRADPILSQGRRPAF